MPQEVWGLLEARVWESRRQGSHSPQPSAQIKSLAPQTPGLWESGSCAHSPKPSLRNAPPTHMQVSLLFSYSLFPPSLGHRSSHQIRGSPGDYVSRLVLTCASVAFLGKWLGSKTQCLGFGFPHPGSCHNETDLHRVFIKPAGAFSLIVFLKNSSFCSPGASLLCPVSSPSSPHNSSNLGVVLSIQ